jgi:hypothetical protein
MFIELLDSARELRSPLAVGYGALAILWISFGNWISGALGRDPLAVRIQGGFHSLGAATTFAIVTFVAAMLGSAIWTFCLRRFVRNLTRKLDHPDWARWIDEAKREVHEYEQYKVEPQLKQGRSGLEANSSARAYYVPSRHHGDHLEAEVADRTRKQSEVEFRIVLAIVSLFISLSLILAGGLWWWWSLIPPVLIWIEVMMLKQTTEDLIDSYAQKELELNIVRFRNLLSGQQGEMSVEMRRDTQEKLSAATAELDRLNRKRNRRGSKIIRSVNG